MAGLVKSNRDLASEPNNVQARYELNRAIDRNDAAAQAEWARERGESALDRAALSAGEYGWQPSDTLCNAVRRTVGRVADLRMALAADKPDIIRCIQLLDLVSNSAVTASEQLDIEE